MLRFRSFIRKYRIEYFTESVLASRGPWIRGQPCSKERARTKSHGPWGCHLWCIQTKYHSMPFWGNRGEQECVNRCLDKI